MPGNHTQINEAMCLCVGAAALTSPCLMLHWIFL